jgi:hypothetical protein
MRVVGVGMGKSFSYVLPYILFYCALYCAFSNMSAIYTRGSMKISEEYKAANET